MIGHHGPAFAFWLSYLDSPRRTLGAVRRHGAGDPARASERPARPAGIRVDHRRSRHRPGRRCAVPRRRPPRDRQGCRRRSSPRATSARSPCRTARSRHPRRTSWPRSGTRSRSITAGSMPPARSSDPTGPLLRLGALVSHTVSADEQFTEVAECLLDVPSRVAWAPGRRGPAAQRDRHRRGHRGTRVPASRLAPAVAAAHRELDTAAARRGQELSIEADAERVAEITRATEYYAAALAAIDKRRGGADAQRRALLDARAQATIGERDRRLAEISEKYRHQHVLRPYRLHLIDVPVWRLATDVRRGERRWPMVFDYLPLLGTVAPTRCPTCDAHSPLVATKTHLGCGTCVPATTPPAPPGPGGRETAARTCGTERGADRDREPPRSRRAQAAAARQHAGDRPEAARRRPGRPPRPATEHSRTGCRPTPLSPRQTRGAKDRRLLEPGRRGRDPQAVAAHRPRLAVWPPSPGSTGRPGHCTGSAFRPVMLRCRSPSGNYDRPVAGQRGGTAGELSHPSRPVPVPAAVVAGQAPGRGLPLLGAVAPGPRPDASQATHPRSRAPHRPG